MEQSNIAIWERQGELGILSISNGRENYLNNPDFVSLDKLKEWTSEKGLKGILIRGIGRNFSAGADIEKLVELAKDQDLLQDKMTEGKKILSFDICEVSGAKDDWDAIVGSRLLYNLANITAVTQNLLQCN